MLISRTQSKLDEQAKELQDKFKIETKVIQLDFTTQDTTVFDRVKQQVQDLDIGILGLLGLEITLIGESE